MGDFLTAVPYSRPAVLSARLLNTKSQQHVVANGDSQEK